MSSSSFNGQGRRSHAAVVKRGAVVTPPPGLDIPENKVNNTANNEESALRDRFLHLTLSLVGQRVTVTRTDGKVIEGIFHTFTPFLSHPPHMRNKYVLKSWRVRGGSKTKEDDDDDVSFGKTIVIPAELVCSIRAEKIHLDAGNGMKESSSTSTTTPNRDTFATDTEISAGRSKERRELVAAGSSWTTTSSPSESKNWRDAAKGKARAGGLEGSIGQWDQFKANEDLFDVRANFDENLYTTELDKSQINHTDQRHAEKLAKEIESTVSTNMHIAEERGHNVQNDYDEEDKYSGVLPSKAVETKKEQPVVADKKTEKVTSEKKTAVRKETNKKKMNYAASAEKDPNTKKMNYAAAAERKDTNTKKMNYAAAAAKAKPAEDGASQAKDVPIAKAAPVASKEDEGTSAEKEAKTDSQLESENVNADDGKSTAKAQEAETTEKAAAPESKDQPPAEEKEKETNADAAGESKDEEKKPKTRLSATAASFVPGGFSAAAPAAPVPQQQQPPYVQMPGQQGMYPMMNPQYPPSIRYVGVPPPPYGVEQPPQQQHMGPDSESGDGRSAQQQQNVPITYAPGYYGPGVVVHPRGSGHPGGFQPQQMHMVPGASPYHPMYGAPMQQPGGVQNMAQMHGGAPYYQTHGVSPYGYPPHAPVDDADGDYRGGRGGGRGKQRRNSFRKGGRGGGGGRSDSQNDLASSDPNESSSAAAAAANTKEKEDGEAGVNK